MHRRPLQQSLGLAAAVAACASIASAPGSARAQLAGPDTAGYLAAEIPLDFVTLGDGLGTATGLGDDTEVNVALPFSFPWYAGNYSNVVIGANGGLKFVNVSTTLHVGYSNQCLPVTSTTSSQGGPDVAAFWDDLNATQMGEVYWYDDPANGRFIVSWEGVPHASSSTDGISFQVQLYPDGRVQVHWLDVDFAGSFYDGGGSATIGIQDFAGGTTGQGHFVELGCLDGILEDGDAAQFFVCQESDGDGFFPPSCGGADCDDSDPTVNPAAAEVCADGVDQDCNGWDQLSDMDGDGDLAQDCGGGDCDDLDPSLDSLTDGDGDGFASCDDCDDASASTYPGAPEICDEVDQNCDGDSSDELDADGDGASPCDGDCDDTDPQASPFWLEFCDGRDNDCDGFVDNGPDTDGDGFTTCQGDCDDGNPSINPGQQEICDSTDSDCDGYLDGQDDSVGNANVVAGPGPVLALDSTVSGLDTFVSELTIAGPSPSITDVNVFVNIDHTYVGDLTLTVISPLGTEVELVDGEGASGDDFAGTLFDDEAANPIWAGDPPFSGVFRPEFDLLSAFDGESPDGTWTLRIEDDYPSEDDGVLNFWFLQIVAGGDVDADGDGWVDACGDCNPADDSVYPFAEEICGDSVDQDCDGSDAVVDGDGDGYTNTECGGDDCDDSSAAVNPGVDGDSDAFDACEDCNDSDSLINPDAEETLCNGIDEDCDGVDLAGSADVDGDGYSVCTGDCDEQNVLVNPGVLEVCDNGVDEDCSGAPSDLDADGDGFSACGLDCDDSDAAVSPAAQEACDDVDSDCDGHVDGQDESVGAQNVIAGPGPGLLIDSSVTGITDFMSQLSAAGPSTPISDMDVMIHILHTYDADLEVWLRSPAGTEVLLVEDEGGSGNHFDQTVFDDEAEESIEDGSAPFAGRYVPEGSLSDFDGEDLNGTWTLEITDSYPGLDDGELLGWGLSFVVGPILDADGDGWVVCGDCDDGNADVNGGADEICEDGIDNDCVDGDAASDNDADGYTNADCSGDDCDDDVGAINPAAAEVCANGIDDDCDAGTPDVFDGDGDGATCDIDCDDENALAWPGFAEICGDGADNDCDPATTDLGDNDGDGFNCADECDDSNAGINPAAAEILCSGVEEDCDPVNAPDVDDGDGDSFDCDVDCDDDEPATNPAAFEIPCDGVDNDCNAGTEGDVDEDGDGSTCNLDCDDEDPARSPDFDEECDDGIDNDCDPSTADVFDSDADGFACNADCDDEDALSYPGAPEICADGIDQDCDSEVDELVDDEYDLDDEDSVLIGLCSFSFSFCGTDWSAVYVQDDGRLTFGFDTQTSNETEVAFLAQVPEIAFLWTDLDPSAGGSVSITEVDGIGLSVEFSEVPEFGLSGTENSVSIDLYSDGTAVMGWDALSADDGIVGFACSELGAAPIDITGYPYQPGQTMIGQGTEGAVYQQFSSLGSPNDLAGSSAGFCLTAGTDADGDGWTGACGDCDDASTVTYPGAAEVCDGADNDCDGTDDDVDADGDGYLDENCGGGDDCDDLDATVNPGAGETCNGNDDDCDGIIGDEEEDIDTDGFTPCEGDCDDGEASANPDAEELCNEIDDDCDGVVDEGFTPDLDDDGFRNAGCGGDDCDDAVAAAHPGAEEICDGYDNDCNGIVNDVDADGDGHVDAGCSDSGTDCDDGDATVNPDAAELPYDGIDQDCSGDDLVDADGDGYASTEVAGGTDCDDADASSFPGAEEDCEDGADNDCDGMVDSEDPEDCESDDAGGCPQCQDSEASLAGGRASRTPLAVLLAAIGAGSLRRRRRPGRAGA
jgi:subtilisin-like proprotein convertase family protein